MRNSIPPGNLWLRRPRTEFWHPTREHRHAEPLDEALRVPLVPRRRQHHRRLALSRERIDLARRSDRVEQEDGRRRRPHKTRPSGSSARSAATPGVVPPSATGLAATRHGAMLLNRRARYGGRRSANATTASRTDPGLVASWTTSHPALIPHEVAGGPRPHPLIPATAPSKSPARAGNPRLSPLGPEAPRPACHAGGRGFESRRSRKKFCKSA